MKHPVVDLNDAYQFQRYSENIYKNLDANGFQADRQKHWCYEHFLILLQRDRNIPIWLGLRLITRGS